VTLGHLDLLARAASLFGRVTVAVARNPEKQRLFATGERIDLLEQATRDIPGVQVTAIDGLVVDAARELGASVIVRGVRSGTDFDYEVQMARTNRTLMPEIDTVLLAPSPAHAHVSSTLVRQIAAMGGDPTPFVPECVAEALRARFHDRK